MKFATLLIKALIDSECFTNQSLWITSGAWRHLIKKCSPRQGAERAPSYQTALLVKTLKCSVVGKWVFLSPICVQITHSVSFGWSPSSRGGQRNLFSWSTQALPKPQNVSVVITLLQQAPDVSARARMPGDALILHRLQRKWVHFVQTKWLHLSKDQEPFPIWVCGVALNFTQNIGCWTHSCLASSYSGPRGLFPVDISAKSLP